MVVQHKKNCYPEDICQYFMWRTDCANNRQTFQRVPSGSARTGMGGASSYRGRGGDQSARSGGGTARSGQQHYSGMDPAIVASKAVEVRTVPFSSTPARGQ